MKLHEFNYTSSPREDRADVMLAIITESKKHLEKWPHNVCSIPFKGTTDESGNTAYRIELHTRDYITSKLY